MNVFYHQIFWTIFSISVFMYFFLELSKNLHRTIVQRDLIIEKKEKKLLEIEQKNKELEDQLNLLIEQKKIKEKKYLEEVKKRELEKNTNILQKQKDSLKIDSIGYRKIIFDINSIMDGFRRVL